MVHKPATGGHQPSSAWRGTDWGSARRSVPAHYVNAQSCVAKPQRCVRTISGRQPPDIPAERRNRCGVVRARRWALASMLGAGPGASDIRFASIAATNWTSAIQRRREREANRGSCQRCLQDKPVHGENRHGEPESPQSLEQGAAHDGKRYLASRVVNMARSRDRWLGRKEITAVEPERVRRVWVAFKGSAQGESHEDAHRACFHCGSHLSSLTGERHRARSAGRSPCRGRSGRRRRRARWRGRGGWARAQ